ncbi:hypothetical protein H3H54_14525 [Brachybacterium sp. Z12]|uniref:hypothetical protein n=1 Tax=Brachybacterium sp. Z12 TaxID=2759167 RepID=UPI0018602A62|nr:hypothetical protein [Brachybacterium sp. Z12]QNN82270.1 hypothetical protein H3H54_14525 [Brachybacterium sp. Z12]
MRHPERVRFSWHPSEPVRSFECAVVTDSDDLAAQTYAVSLSVRDAAGDDIAPKKGPWLYSNSLERFFQYNQATEDEPTFRLETWISEIVIDAVHVEVIAWKKDREAPSVLGMAFSPTADEPPGARSWVICPPMGEAA